MALVVLSEVYYPGLPSGGSGCIRAVLLAPVPSALQSLESLRVEGYYPPLAALRHASVEHDETAREIDMFPDQAGELTVA